MLLSITALGLILIYLPNWWQGLFSDDRTQQLQPRPKVVVIDPQQEEPPQDQGLDKKGLAEMIGFRPFKSDEIHAFSIEDAAGNPLYIQTTLDPDLQAWAVKFIPKVKALSAALVVMAPTTGHVLAMASYRSDGRPVNVALTSNFPAASLFKIITAAAALENKEMTGGSTLAYDGGKHTLYKRQIKGGIEKGRHQVTLKKSFAQSINTVFGKLGAFTLGPEALETFAQRFYFNQPIDFEMPVQTSQFESSEKEDLYHLAELASGFNRTTKVSPLHGAMLASAIINNGRLMEPTIVREVFNVDNHIFYQHHPEPLGEVVSLKTVKELRNLMRATVVEGTGRRRFRDLKRHKVLRRLEIGGKSGTINNDEGHRVDWFVSYAKVKDGDEAIALAAVVVHGSKIGLRSQEIVRETIIRYFQSRLSGKKH